jgi:hypothetical protein
MPGKGAIVPFEVPTMAPQIWGLATSLAMEQYKTPCLMTKQT